MEHLAVGGYPMSVCSCASVNDNSPTAKINNISNTELNWVDFSLFKLHLQKLQLSLSLETVIIDSLIAACGLF